jgi:predicted nucleic acid-binding Zn ribbon protein
MPMTELHTHCEICGSEPAIDGVWGEVDGLRQLWFCCKECREMIKNQRKAERRKNA